jgi:hypothetical protein
VSLNGQSHESSIGSLLVSFSLLESKREIKSIERAEINGRFNLRGQWHKRLAPNYCTYSNPLPIVPLSGFP